MIRDEIARVVRDYGWSHDHDELPTTPGEAADEILQLIEASMSPLNRPSPSATTRAHLVRSGTAERRAAVTTRQGIATHGEQPTTEDE